MKILRLSLPAAAFLVGSLFGAGPPVDAAADEPVASVTLPAISRQTAAARAAAEADDASLEDRIRFASWALMLAEFAIEPHGLVSTASDLFEEGQNAIDAVRAELAANADEEKALVMRAPLLAARLDAAVVRRERIAARQEIARGKERERLDDLRSIAKAFRTGLAAQSEAQAWAAIGDADRAEASLAEAWQALDTIDRTVARRRDFYLMEDEPDVEANPDATLVTVAPTAFRSPVVVANAKALAALRLLAVIERPGYDPYLDPEASKILERVTALANAALSDDANLPGAPRGSSANNTFALYARGRAAVLSASLRAWSSPVDAAVRNEVTATLRQAAADYTAALANLGDYADTSLHARLKDCVDDLESPTHVRARVTTFVDEGLYARAVIEARGLAMLHPAPDFVAFYLDTARRAGVPLGDLQDWVRRFVAGGSGLDPTASPSLRIALGRIAAEATAGRVTSAEWPTAQAEERESAAREALAARDIVSTPDGTAEAAAAELAATRALLAAYAWISWADIPGGKALLATAVDDAQNAELFLSRTLAEAVARDPRADVFDVRESLVHCRLARGFLAVALLPDYRDEARLAFAAALDEAGRLPAGGRDHGMLGSPLLTSLLRGEGAGQTAQLVAQERAARQAMTRFVEASFAMEFGTPAQAAEQFKIAQDIAQRGNAGLAAADAAEMMRGADGFDVTIALPETMAAFEVLGFVAAGRHDEALRRAADLSRLQAGRSADDSARDDTSLLEAIARDVPSVRTPLVAYAILRALTARFDAMPVGQDAARGSVLEALRKCHAKCADLLASSRQRDRYPHVIALVADIGKGLDDPGAFLAATDLGTIECGLRRHPGSTKLWARYFDLAAAASTGAAEGRKSAERSLAMLDALAEDPLVPVAALRLSRAALLERLAQYQPAEQEYARVRQTGTTAEDRIVAASREAVLMVRNVFPSDSGRE